ncbi:MAG: cupin [Gammaproteobacteria bacterium BRH_c0]|nr:MAG: cupin [Gammaproteobacteria bacterium BRH_c0]
MATQLKQFNSNNEYYFQEGCFIIECSNSADDPAVSIARARVGAGKTTRWHRLLNTTERYLILSGTGIAETEDQPATTLTQGDVLIIPAGHAQRIHNPGNSDLVFLAICSPRFEVRNYQDVEGLV